MDGPSKLNRLTHLQDQESSAETEASEFTASAPPPTQESPSPAPSEALFSHKCLFFRSKQLNYTFSLLNNVINSLTMLISKVCGLLNFEICLSYYDIH